MTTRIARTVLTSFFFLVLALTLFAACGEKKPAAGGNQADSTKKPVNPCPTGR